MPRSFKKGDKVGWDTSQGETHGRVIRKQASETQIKGHEVAATKTVHSTLFEATSRAGRRRTSWTN